MPQPKPKDGESQRDFHSRCMSNPTMKKEYPKQDQRNAVCYREWRKVHGKESAAPKERKIHSTFGTFPIMIKESLMGKPLVCTGIAMKVGKSRNNNVYPEHIVKQYETALVDASIYGEHISVFDAIGRVTKTWFIHPYLYYDAEIWDEDFADKIRRGIIKHVSPSADYQSIEYVNGRMPVGLPQNAELSLVAVAGIPDANIKVKEALEKQVNKRQVVKNTTPFKLPTKLR